MRRRGRRKLSSGLLIVLVTGVLIGDRAASAEPEDGFVIFVTSTDGDALINLDFPASAGWVFGDRYSYKCVYFYLQQGEGGGAKVTIERVGAYEAFVNDKFGVESRPQTPCGTNATPLTFGGAPAPFTIGATTFPLEGLLSDESTWATGGCAAGSPYNYLIYDGEPILKATVESLGAVVGPCSSSSPSISSFSPTSGPFGTTVVLTGSNFVGVSSVSFRGSLATTFSVDSPTQISVKLPRGAKTGMVSVTNADGSASGPRRFTVTHRAILVLRLRRSGGALQATGAVGIPDGTQQCQAGRRVIIENVVNGDWRTLGTVTTHPDGSFTGRVRLGHGSLRGRLTQRRLEGGDICEPTQEGVGSLQ